MTAPTKKIALPSWTGTAAGGIAGLALAGVGLVALPIAIPVALVAGAGLDLYRHKHGHKLTIGVAGGPSAAPPLQVMKMIVHASPKAAAAPVAAAAASQAAAAAPIPEATRLQDYLMKYPGDRIVMGPMFFQNAPVPGLVTDFQTAFNNDAPAVKALGTLPVTGAYDASTSAALAYYTHEPIAAP